ncbi:response regulator [Salinicoccus halitifaciens]|uniref:Transcriptional regulatory protein n=1 Tax=Salinicoccus halitifaciens TaxID=1073415 RepID=A0ABV2E8W6_9STAP|nr:response regulator [Salinicoccus halitifaciens]MCD2137885.1 response regulator [Salinicoccus halitifaciens]
MKILIVEDDFRIADLYKEYLQQHLKSVEVHKANNASESLKILEEVEMELMLVDIYLPDMLGDELMEAVIRKHPYMDFIVITAAQEGEVFKKMMQLGAKYYLVKPVKLQRLAETVKNYMEKRKFIQGTHEIDQDKIDEYFGQNKKIPNEEFLPKGVDPVTLRVVEEAFEKEKEWTSSTLGEYLGTSRTTVRRYLEYLKSAGKLEVSQEYGDKGRPEKKYKKK